MSSTIARRRRRAAWQSSGGMWALIFALPAVIVFALFAWGPIIQAAVMSFQKTNLVKPAEWVGLGNFTYVLADPLLPTALLNTLWFTVLALVLGFPVPLVLAVFLAELRKTGWLYSVLAYLPVVIPPVVAVLLWKVFYDPSTTGLFNGILGIFGIAPQPWLNSAGSAMPSIVLEVTWANAGSTVIIYLAALVAVRRELYDAAELDGAGILSRVWHVTLPQIRGVILIMMLLQIVGTMQVFTEVYIFTGGGPNHATLTLLLMIYNYAFVNGDFGAATALSVLLALLLAAFSAVFQLATRRWGTT